MNCYYAVINLNRKIRKTIVYSKQLSYVGKAFRMIVLLILGATSFSIAQRTRPGRPSGVLTQVATVTTIPASSPVTVIDNDQDGIDDNIEKKLLERFRPYFLFSDDGGEDNFRPTDVWQYVRTADLHTDGDEDGKYTMIQQSVLFNNPEAILVENGKYGASDITLNARITAYRINPNENVPGISQSNPGRHGSSWNEELTRRNIGLYGHVGIIQIRNPALTRFDRNLAGSNQLINYYKVEYWQFFGYNSAGKMGDIGDHEGDWTSVQIIYDPRGDSIFAVMHYAHGMEFRFNKKDTRDSLPLTMAEGKAMEYRGSHYNTSIDLVSHDLKFTRNQTDYNMAQNNVLCLFQDAVTAKFSHPVVYIEHGTHEFFPSANWNYYAAPNHNGRSHQFLTSTPPNLGEVEHPFQEDPAAMIILKFNGYWGAYCKANCSPPGPPLHENWAWPSSSSIRWQLNNLTF